MSETTEKRVLVVDDEELIRIIFSRALTQAGYSVRTATTAEQAIELMRDNPAELLYLDLNLPGMNGLELCKLVRKHWPWSITVAVTGFASLFDLLECREAGFEDYFLKPVELAELLATAEHSFKKLARWKAR